MSNRYEMYVPKSKFGEHMLEYMSESYAEVEGILSRTDERRTWTIVKVQVTEIE